MNTLSTKPSAAGEEGKGTGTAPPPAAEFDEWALVEIMGHQRIVGRVTEQVVAGAAFLRVDVPESEGKQGFTRFYSPGAVYCISPISEQTARGMVASMDAEPVKRFDIVKQLAAGPVQAEFEGEEDSPV